MNASALPISSIVKALCQAANAGPDLLYEVMLKLSLVVEARAPMFGLSIWRVEYGQKPKLKWAEGLDEPELAQGESLVSELLTPEPAWPVINAGDSSIRLLLASARPGCPGAALFGLCVRPLSPKQASDLGAIMDVVRLAHAHVLATRAFPAQQATEEKTSKTSLPGMIFASRAMNEVARN